MIQMNPQEPTVTWRVTYQNEGFDSVPGSGLVRGATVGIEVNGSIQGSVFVPVSELGTRAGWERINARALELAATSAFTHDTPPPQ